MSRTVITRNKKTNSDSSELHSSNVTKGKHGKVNMKLKICRGHHCYYEALPSHNASCTLTTMDLTVEMSDEWMTWLTWENRIGPH